jgi:hypothetical protein
MIEKGKTPQTNPFESEDAHSELLRASRLCHPDWESTGRLTFRPPLMNWAAWRDTVFLPSIRPAFAAAFNAFVQGHRRELAQSDSVLDAALPPKLAEASRRAGQRLITGYTVPNAEKLWLHYRDRVTAGEAPGHFAVALAVRAAAFHLPQPLALSAMLFFEARGGHDEGLPAEWAEMIASALPKDGASQLRAA